MLLLHGVTWRDSDSDVDVANNVSVHLPPHIYVRTHYGSRGAAAPPRSNYMPEPPSLWRRAAAAPAARSATEKTQRPYWRHLWIQNRKSVRERTHLLHPFIAAPPQPFEFFLEPFSLVFYPFSFCMSLPPPQRPRFPQCAPPPVKT